MAVIKKHIFHISVLLIILASGILCAYAIVNYHGSTAPSRNTSEAPGFQQGERTQPSGMPGQTTANGGQVSNNTDQAPGGQNQAEGQATGDGGQAFNTTDQTQNGQTHAADQNQRQRNRQPGMSNQPGGQPSGQSGDQPAAPSGGRGFGGITNAGIKYAPYLLTYAALFLFSIIAACFLLLRKKIRIDPAHEKILVLALLGAGLLLRIAAATLVEGHNDVNLFRSWASSAAGNLLQFYDGARSSDYPPLYIYVLCLIGKIAAIPAVGTYYTILLKLPSIAADIATSYLIYRLARKYLSPETGVLLSAFYVFNPAVFINSTFWGQVDSFFTLIVVAAVTLLAEKKTVLASVLFAAAVLMKPQGLIFLPVFFFELVRQKSLTIFIKAAVAALGTAAAIVMPFSYNKGALWIYNLFAKTTGEYPYASVNAFNFFGLIEKNWVKDSTVFWGLSYHTWGMIFIVAVTLLAWFLYYREKSSLFAPAAALLLITGVFTLSTRMHERYLFPAVALVILAFIYLKDKRLLLLSAGFSATVFLNTHFVLFKTSGMNAFPYSPALIGTSILNVLLLGYLVWVLFDMAVRKRKCTKKIHKMIDVNS